MTMTRRIAIGVSVALVFLASAVHAQIEPGRVAGVVKDSQGGVLPGVTVTARSAALMGQRVMATEGDGRYLLVNLPSGTYTLTFELEGFTTLSRENVRVTVGNTLSMDVQLDVATLQENVTVSAASPVVDTTTTKVGSEFSAEKLVSVPTATDVWSALAQTPGVRMQGFDVGGSHKSQQTSYEGFGVRGQSRGMIESIDMTENVGAFTTYVQLLAVDELNVSSLGGDVEMNSPGTAFTLVYKSGGNKFSGIEQITYGPGRLVGNNIDTDTAARGYTGNPNLIFWEGHLDLGGPVLQDKLWFFGAVNGFQVDKAISGIDPSVAVDDSWVSDWFVKLTYKMTSKDTLIGFYQPRNHKVKKNRGLSVSTSPDSVLAQASDGWIKKLEWQRIWTSRLFMDVRGALCCANWPAVAKVDALTHPARLDRGTGLVTGAGWNAFNFGIRKPQISGLLTYFRPTTRGSHDVKGGFEWIDTHFQQGINGQSGPIRYLDRLGAVDEIELIDVGRYEDFGKTWQPSRTMNRMGAVFVQDRWSPTNHLTLTFGLRGGYQRPYFEAGSRDPVLKELFPVVSTPDRTLFSRTSVAPRVGVTFDLFGDGRTAVKGFYGRYYSIYAWLMRGANPGDVNSKTFKFLDQNGNLLYDGLHELGTLVGSSGGATTAVDADMKQPYGEEVSGTIEHQFWGESSARFSYVRKMLKNTFGVVNTARIGTITERVSVRDPFDPVGAINALDIPASLSGVVRNVFTSVAGGDAIYDNVSFSAQKRLRGGVFVQGGFDYQWRDELRQPDTLSTSPLSTDPIGAYVSGDTFPLAYSADVPNRQNTTTWAARLLGRYELPFGLAVGTNVRVQSGFPWSPVATIRLPNAGTQRVFVDDLKERRSDNVAIIDFRLDKSFALKGLKVTGMVDVFNVLNSNAVTNFFVTSGGTYNRIIAALDPRTVHVALRASF